MEAYLLIDFGSTYTKVTAIDLEGEVVLGTAQASTTIETDVRVGLDEALRLLQVASGLSLGDYAGKYACSSAAGGLKMVSIGLVPSLTLEAARRAALGAGAKVIGSYGYELSSAQAAEIEAMTCDIVMLAGGTNGGNKDVIRHNADKLAQTGIACPILVCGNTAVQDEIARKLEASGKKVYLADNVLPEVDQVRVESAQSVIREIFVKHITKAKGLEYAAKFIGRDIIPTPKASLNAASLIAEGSKHEPGMGSILVLEIGGATINVHSVEEVKPVTPQTIVRGLPENKVKRTVEGDLGIRWNANTICELVGAETIMDNLRKVAPDIDVDSVDPATFTSFLARNTSHKPETPAEWAFDIALAYSAADVAVRRHAGTARKETVAIGEVDVQRGKNLLDVRNVIGIGGIFRYGQHPERILPAAAYDLKNPESLRPVHPNFYLDTTYVLYAVGLLSQDHPDQALRIAKKYLRPVDVATALPVSGGYANRGSSLGEMEHGGCGGLMAH
ncbi:methylaspartate mutase accessory protein GlmL [Gordonibacter massiliensis (ex Traore et al. 2017)]|uniref:Glutamate mutase L n=1 Tax=Gordonibacter massiliensis (ex Traore et al. 2017) TaxID=1841863 RepID=A0A842JDJ2_9ACTN|nr:methylaspartate mutase accessory protein GlmL [Gordonibacter massiliensis (ex Traore et al. 2017)]MBC2888986.1 glutamate mutase L [Gordonibacter massiliensis (ex Traore et al. 2017)]